MIHAMRYDRDLIASFFDAYGEREWERLESSPRERVSFEVHRRLLDENVRQGDRVLEVGAGPGRFTLELARLGARVTVTDLSAGQLELHREKTAAIEGVIEERTVADVVDLSRFEDSSFDVAVAYGGPVSYVVERADEAMAELLRVTRPGGRVLITFMSLVGAVRMAFDFFPELVERFGWERAVGDVIRTGDLDAEINNGHVMRMYRWRDVEQLLAGHPCRLLAASAANYLSVERGADLEGDPRWLDVEVQLCREPGILDAGTHIIVAVERS